MQRTWFVEGLEMMTLLDRLLHRTLPPPFSYVSPTAQTRIDALHEEARTWKQIQANWEPDLADLLTWTGDPELRIQVSSWDTRAVEGPCGMVGYRRESRAALIQGFYDRSGMSCERYRVVECDPAELSSLIVEALPEMPAGSQDRIELSDYDAGATHASDDWSRSSRSSFYDDGDDDVDVRSRRWQQAPKSVVGMLGFHQGSWQPDTEGNPVQYLFWEDHPDDGRYLIDLSPPVSAVGIDLEGLRQRIDQKSAETLRIMQDASSDVYARSSVFDD